MSLLIFPISLVAVALSLSIFFLASYTEHLTLLSFHLPYTDRALSVYNIIY